MGVATFCLLLAIFSNAFANLLLKKASANVYVSNYDMYLSSTFIAGMAFFGLNMIAYSRALKNYPLGIAYPLLVGGSLIMVVLMANFFLGESIPLKNIIGIALILIGTCFVI